MEDSPETRIDILVVAAANLFNLLMVIVFLLRMKEKGHHVFFAILWVAISLLLIFSGGKNLIQKRKWWSYIIPFLFALFLVVEVLFDYIFKLEFRSTALLGPYLLLYYLSILGMIGYAFLIQRRYGYFTLITYFLSQINAMISYIIVGHG